jgi:hypothetical protein
MNSAATAEAKVGDEAEFGGPPSPGAEPGEFGGGTKSEEELKAIDLSIVLQRIGNDRDRIGREFGNAMIALRDTLKPGKNWMAYLEWLGIKYDLANKWINRAENNETKHGKKKPKAETPNDETQAKDRSPDVAVIARTLKKLADDVQMLKIGEHDCSPIVEPLRQLADALGFKTEPTEGNNA